MVADQARAAGLDVRWGRKVLELRPPIAADKGTAVRSLLDERSLRRGLYAGDDTTDLDGFRGLDACELAVRVAVVSGEAPAGLADAADVVVGSPAELLDLLREPLGQGEHRDAGRRRGRHRRFAGPTRARAGRAPQGPSR